MKLKRLICQVAGHNYHLVHSYFDWLHKLKCTRCGKFFALNEHMAAIIPWDEPLEFLLHELTAITAAEKKAQENQVNNELKNQDLTFTVKANYEGNLENFNTLFTDPGRIVPGDGSGGPGS